MNVANKFVALFIGLVWVTQLGASSYPRYTQWECEQTKGVWVHTVGRDGPGMYCDFPEQKKSCIAGGGDWVPWGGTFTCRQPSKDGGKACYDSAECQYGCVVPATALSNRNASPTPGSCAPDNLMGGCRQSVQNGKPTISCIR